MRGRYSELPAATRAEVDHWVSLLVTCRDDEQEMRQVMRAARAAVSVRLSWWRRLLRRAANWGL